MALLLNSIPELHQRARTEFMPHITRFIAMIESGHCTWEELHEAAEHFFMIAEPICGEFPDPIFNDNDLILFTGDTLMIVPAPISEDPSPN
jgi:hypothetical protein